MDLKERFIKYVKVDTTSLLNSSQTPSTSCQFDLAEILEEELKELGLETKLVKECIVYGKLKGNAPGDKIGFIAHMDTVPAVSGKNVNPRVIENYDGKDIILNEKENIIMTVEEFPYLSLDKGCDLIVTDGTTLLGADDKAGIAEIMSLLQYLKDHPEVKHPEIRVAFTPDEEVYRGTENFDVKFFDADYAYTLDGGRIGEVNYENFNAASAEISIRGLSIHTGSAKGKMVNSLLVAMEFQSLLPVFDNPAYTENYEGFNHLETMSGNVDQTNMSYILRNHDAKLLEKQKQDFITAAEFINKKYGNILTLKLADSYRNMAPLIKENFHIVEKVKDAMKDLDIEFKAVPIRGGTDGATLSYMGLLCPNLPTGGRNFHGRYEYANLNEMEKIVELLIHMVTIK